MKTKIFKGEKITIKKLSERDLGTVKKFQDFINSFVKEDAQIMMNKEISLKEERGWLKDKIAKTKNKKTIYLFAEHKGSIVGASDISLHGGRQSHVAEFGITVKKGYRNIGLGTYLLKEVIKLAKKELKPKPKIIKLGVFATNKPALAFYKKQGLKKVARIPKNLSYRGRLIDEIIMLKYL